MAEPTSGPVIGWPLVLALGLGAQGTLTRAPELKDGPAPAYPEPALQQAREGAVLLRLTLDEAGLPARVEVAESAGADEAGRALDWAALGAGCAFRFSPAEVDGRPAGAVITYRLDFRLPTRAAAPAAGAAPATAGATFTLAGRVRREGTVRPLAFAEASLTLLLPGGATGEPVTVLADDQGRFELGPLPEGPYRIEVGLEGYAPLVDEEYLEGNVDAPRAHALDVSLLPLLADDLVTVVRARKTAPPVSRVSLSRAEVRGIPGTYGDALRVLESLPGVARAPLLGGALMVRGGYPADTAVHFEGVPIPVLYHFGGFTSVINGAFIEEISFFAGGYPARYGNATAGIVDVRAHELDAETLEARLDADAFDLGFFFGGQVRPVEALPALRLGFAARRSHAEIPGSMVLSMATAAQAPIPFLPVPLYYDYQLKLESAVSSSSELSLFAFGAEDSWAVLGDAPALGTDANGEPLDLDLILNTFLGNRWHRLLGRWELTPVPGVTHTLSPYAGMTRRGLLSDGVAVPILSGTTLDVPTDELNWGGRDELAVRPHPWLRLVVGAEHHATRSTVQLVPGADLFDTPLPEDAPSAVRASASSSATYAELQLGPLAGVELTPALRVELSTLRFDEERGRPLYGERADSTVDNLTLDPRLSARWELTPGFALKAAGGLFHQRPRLQSAAFDTDGVGLMAPQALHVIGGFEAQLAEGLSLDAQVYGVQRTHLSRERARLYDPLRSAPPISVPGSFDSQGYGNTQGFELLLRQAPSRWFFGWVSYTFSRTEVALGDRREEVVPFPFDQTHNLVMVGKLLLPWQATLGARFAFVTGNPRPIPDAISVAHDLAYNTYGPILSTLRPSRLDPFHRLDVRLDKRWIFEWASVVTFLEVINLYNWPNPEVVFPGGDFRAREVRTLLPGPPFLPLLGAEVEL